ncbi:hypothetical protein BDV28DRAFT_120892 [Aspergillus coremiiformis]|uniref:Copper-fist domain-containing protein n=1 Tax=Aspergillus coremiiformis TaxID=138285 RepID=A0A5N6Z5R1_9EURO|nr:hypothetical protein BDV28DRAFT_120892 [Aspergillus coremiiformis]
MPLDEEGAKWSCEPCIRGHRSSKCQHFDRLMMKVPKAGRPLAKCPHPKGTCSCQKLFAFMIRIPKGSTCLCRPVYQVPVDQNDSAPTTPTTSAPTASPAPGKIQKSSRRQMKTAPESIAKALGSIPDFGKQRVQNGSSSHLSPYNPGVRTIQNSLPQSVGVPNPRLTHQILDNSEDLKPQGRSCCSQKPHPSVQTKPQDSNCKKPESPTQNGHSAEPTTDRLSVPFTPSLTATSSFTPISTPQISSWQDLNAAEQNHFYSQFVSHQPPTGPPYLPDYLLHATPKAVALSFPHRDFTDNGLTQAFIPHSLPQHGHDSGYTASENIIGDSPHACSCGDNCQCLGCAAHPFNNTTRQHVQEMGLLVAFDGEDQTMNHMNGYRTPSLHSKQHNAAPLDYPYTNFSHTLHNNTQPLMMHSYGEQASTPGFATTGYSSPPAEYMSEQQLMEPSEYYTLEYPVGLPSGCSDVTGSCQCGNDCSCVGCLTHSGHNGFSLDPVTSEASNLSPICPVTSPDNSGFSMPRAHTLNDISVPSLSPRI